MRNTIFVSSTFQDLKIHRRAVWEVLSTFDVSVRGMEQFGARPEMPLQTCIDELEQSDIYIGIIAFRHGSIEPGSGKSYTQLEYERALDLKKEIYIYLVDEENAKVSYKNIDQGESLGKLNAFKRMLRERHTVDTFVDEKDLAIKVQRDLARKLALKKPVVFAVVDDGEKSSSVLSQFFLMPKSVAGEEVLLELKVKGVPYPASRDVCEAFNMDFGSAAGVSVEIIQPKEHGSKGLTELFFDGHQATQVCSLGKNNGFKAYVRLNFVENPIDNIKARWKTEVTYPYAKGIYATGLGMVGDMLGEPVYFRADSFVAMTLSKIIERAGEQA